MVQFPHTITGQELWRWRQQAVSQAKTTHINTTEVDWLLQGVCQVKGLALRLGTLVDQDRVAAQVSLAELEQLWAQRVRDRVPVQHLVGQTPWRNFTLQVSPSVLIPRPETELIIDQVVLAVEQSPAADQLRRGTWVDLGTGSGAIALGLADVLPEAEILAVDISAEALEIAKQNARENGLSDRIQFFQGAWFKPITAWQGRLAGVVSNPPYIPSAIVPTLQPEVTNHEPHIALDGGQDGLMCVQHLIHTAPFFLHRNGIWLVELMMGQASGVIELLTQTNDYRNIQPCLDLAGIERFVLAQRQ